MPLAESGRRASAGSIAVTGASGWLGRSVVRAAREDGLEVVGVARSREAAQLVASAGAQPLIAPDLDAGLMAEGLGGCVALVHLAGISAERDGATYAEAIVGGTRRAIEAAQRAGVPRLVYLSGLGVARYGISRRSTNGYFLAKLSAEVELFRSGLEAVVFRPSYIVGPEDELIPALLDELAAGVAEIVGDGGYRMQPVAVGDACAAVLAGARAAMPGTSVFDLVGPEPVAYRDLVRRVAAIAGVSSGADAMSWRVVPVEEADRRAASGGYRGFLPDELDVLLCDEISDPQAIERLLGRALTPLDETLRSAVAASRPRAGASFRRAGA